MNRLKKYRKAARKNFWRNVRHDTRGSRIKITIIELLMLPFRWLLRLATYVVFPRCEACNDTGVVFMWDETDADQFCDCDAGNAVREYKEFRDARDARRNTKQHHQDPCDSGKQ